MQVTDEVNRDETDFTVFGAMLAERAAGMIGRRASPLARTGFLLWAVPRANLNAPLRCELPLDLTRDGALVYRRAMAYFAPDWAWICVLVLLIAVSVAVGLLEAWPLAVLIDSVLTSEPKGDWVHGLFLSVLPADKMGQVVGLVLIAMAAQIVGYLAWLGRMMINYHLNYRGTTRVRYDLFSKLQELGLTYHRSRAQGDAIGLLSGGACEPCCG